MVRLWGRDDRFALKDAVIAAALDRSLQVEGQRPDAPRPIEIGVDLDVPAPDAITWFCDPVRWTRFQGQQAWLDPRPGGRLRLDLGAGVMIRGHYIEVDDRHVTFTWGKESDSTLPPESTEVTVTASPRPGGGCVLILRHVGLPDEQQIAMHRSGWRYHLLRLAVAASGATGETELIDLFLAAASEPDGNARHGLLDRVCVDGAEVSDGHSDDFGSNQVAAQFGRFVESGLRRTRSGPVVRHGAIARCDYVVRRTQDDDTSRSVDQGELVAAVDGNKLLVVSFFERSIREGRRGAHAAADDPWRDAPPPPPPPQPERNRFGW